MGGAAFVLLGWRRSPLLRRLMFPGGRWPAKIIEWATLYIGGICLGGLVLLCVTLIRQWVRTSP